jgi:putative DNA primase/helicase
VTGPYAQAARVYRELGWPSALPVVGKKFGLPPDFTGGHLNWPTDEQTAQWVDTRGADNVVLRLPDNVLGIDVDAHDGGSGLETIENWEMHVGVPLPPTWSSTSRLDGTRIMFYRVPEGLLWKSNFGKNSYVDIIRMTHRYAVVWPSIHPEVGRRYEWYAPGSHPGIGTPAEGPPRPDDLAALPREWVAALQLGTASAAGASRPGERDYSSDPEPELEHDGQRVDVEALFRDGIAIGEQQSMLFAYMCSMRARHFRRAEMINAGMFLLQLMENADGRPPWTPEDVVALVDRVRRDYPAGPSGVVQVGPGGTAWAERMRQALERGGDVGALPADAPLTTDLGNSIRMVAVLGDRIRYAVDEQRWYVWDGRRWAPDGRNRVLDLTKVVINTIREDGAASEGEDRQRLLNWARDSENITRRRAMIAGAESEPSLVVNVDQFDANPDLLVVRNGTLDLRTGELRQSSREDLCSRLAEVDYDPDARCERWLGHISLLCDGDPALAAYLRRAVGYSLTGDVGARSFFFLEGTGSNGKNAFIEPIMMMLGSYAQTATTALLTGGDEQHPTILADLLGARLVFVDETRQGKALNVERVKALTGSKRVKARRMKQDFFEFDAQFKLWIAGNGQPTVRDPSDGVWNRMNRVVCHGKVAPQQRIDRFGDLLYAEEASGILNWALEGLKDYRQVGLGVPESVRRDVQEYRDEEDYTGQFVDDCVVKTGDPGDFVGNAELYGRYQLWALQRGIRGQDLLNGVRLSRELVAHGLTRHKDPVRVNGVKVRGFHGLRLTETVV